MANKKQLSSTLINNVEAYAETERGRRAFQHSPNRAKLLACYKNMQMKRIRKFVSLEIENLINLVKFMAAVEARKF